MAQGRSSIHFSADSWYAGEDISIYIVQLQTGFTYQLIDASIQIAAAAEPVLEGIESILPRGDRGVVAAAMLKEEKAALRFQDPSDLA